MQVDIPEGVLAVHPEIAVSINKIMERLAAGDESALAALKDLAEEDESRDDVGIRSGETLEDRLADSATVRKDAWKLPYEEWRKEFRAFVGRQTARNPDLDHSRESIYS